MRLNLRLHPRRDADLIAHLSRLRGGLLSEELRRLLRAGLNTGGARASPPAEPAPQWAPSHVEAVEGAMKPPPGAEGADLSEIERAIAGTAWE